MVGASCPLAAGKGNTGTRRHSHRHTALGSLKQGVRFLPHPSKHQAFLQQ